MLLVCKADLAIEDIERLRECAADVPNEIRWARRGGRLILLITRARANPEEVAALAEDPAVEYTLSNPSEKEIARLFSRRDILDLALGGTGLLAGAALLAPLGMFLASPAGSTSPRGDVYVGRLEELPVKGTETRRIDGVEFLIVRRDENHIHALAKTCTHSKVCHVLYDRDLEQLVCPCHRGAFDLHGNVLSGPPPRPLATREVFVRDGEIFVKRRSL